MRKIKVKVHHKPSKFIKFIAQYELLVVFYFLFWGLKISEESIERFIERVTTGYITMTIPDWHDPGSYDTEYIEVES